MTLEQIKNEYAKNQGLGFENWIHLLDFYILINDSITLDAHINNVFKKINKR